MSPVSILRWIAVLPGALLAAILVGLIFHAVNALGAVNFLASIVQFPADSNVGAAQFVMGTSHGIAYAAAFVLLGEWIAPSRTDLPAFFGPPITGEQRQSAWLSRSRVLLGQREPASPASAHRHPSQHGAAL